MRFTTAFQLTLRHEYYPDGLGRDFDVQPTDRTLRLLQRHRWMWRPLPNGVRLLMPLVGAGPFIPLLPDSNFTFQLLLRNPEFALFTDFLGFRQLSAPVFVRADASATGGAPQPGSPEFLVLRDRQETTTLTLEMPPRLKQAHFALPRALRHGATPQDVRVDGLGASAQVRIDVNLRGLEIACDPGERARVFSILYPVDPHPGVGTFAEAQIANPLDPPVPGGGAREYAIAFKSRKARWKYVLVTGAGVPPEGFSLEMNGGPNFARSAADPADLLTGTLRQQYPEAAGFDLTTFTSEVAMPCQQRSPAGLRLKQGTDTVIDGLPAPPLRNLCTVGNDTGLFQVLKRIK